jgi:hypothetical protein
MYYYKWYFINHSVHYKYYLIICLYHIYLVEFLLFFRKQYFCHLPSSNIISFLKVVNFIISYFTILVIIIYYGVLFFISILFFNFRHDSFIHFFIIFSFKNLLIYYLFVKFLMYWMNFF